MKALTLTQPWATLVAEGLKRIETRSRNLSYRGMIAIHAGANLVYVGGQQRLLDLCLSEPFAQALQGVDVLRRGRRHDIGTRGQPGWIHLESKVDVQPSYSLVMPRGAIIAIAHIVSAETTENLVEDAGAWRVCGGVRTYWPLDELERAFGVYDPGRYGYLLAGVRKLRTPVPCRGYQRLWRLPDDVEAAVRAQL